MEYELKNNETKLEVVIDELIKRNDTYFYYLGRLEAALHRLNEYKMGGVSTSVESDEDENSNKSSMGELYNEVDRLACYNTRFRDAIEYLTTIV